MLPASCIDSLLIVSMKIYTEIRILQGTLATCTYILHSLKHMELDLIQKSNNVLEVRTTYSV